VSLFATFITIKCWRCGKVHCEATPGSRIRWRCRGCKTMQTKEV